MTDTPDVPLLDATALEHLRVLLGTTWAGQREATLMRRTGGVRDSAVLGRAPAQVAAGRDTADREAFERDEREIRADEYQVRTEMIAAHWRATGARPIWADPDQRDRTVAARTLTAQRDAAQHADMAVVRIRNREYVLHRNGRRALHLAIAATALAAVTAVAALLPSSALPHLLGASLVALLAAAALATRGVRARRELTEIPGQLERALEHQADANGRVVLAMTAHYLAGGDPWSDPDTWPAVRRTTIPLYG